MCALLRFPLEFQAPLPGGANALTIRQHIQHHDAESREVPRVPRQVALLGVAQASERLAADLQGPAIAEERLA